MNQEQFGQFWTQLKEPLKAQWEKITDEDLLEIAGNLATFGRVAQKRYGEAQKDEVIHLGQPPLCSLDRKLCGCGIQGCRSEGIVNAPYRFREPSHRVDEVC